MSYVKRIERKIVAGLLSLVLLTTGSPAFSIGNQDQERKAQRASATEYVNNSDQVQSNVQIRADLDSVAKKVKEQSEKKTSNVPEQSLASTGPEYKKQRDEAPFRIPRTNEMVSTLSGSVHLRVSDLTLPGRNGHSFELARVYDSSTSQLWEMDTVMIYGNYGIYYENKIKESYSRQHYPIGSGWSFDLPYIDTSDGNKYLHFEGGSYFVHDLSPEGMKPHGYIWDDLLFFKDTSVAVGIEQSQYMLKSIRDGKKYYFDYRGNLMQISDENGNSIRFYFWYEGSYSPGHHLVRIADDLGNEITLTYTATQVIAKQGNKQVTYNKIVVNGNRELLTAVTDPAGRRTVYDYEVRDANFDLVGSGSYHSNPYALLTGATHPTGAKSVYAYENKPSRRNLGGKAWVEVFRVNSLEEQLAKNDGTIERRDRLTATYQGGMGMTNPFAITLQNLDSQHTYEHMLDTSPINSVYSQPFFKRTKAVHESNGTQKTIRYTYTDPRKLPVPNETSTVWTVNGVASAPRTSSQTFDSYQNVLMKTDESGATTSFSYDPNSHLLQSVTEKVDAVQSRTTEHVRDSRGNITQTIIKNQNGAVLRKENSEYDLYGNQVVQRVTDGGRVTTTQTEFGSWYQSAFPTKETVQVTDADGVVSTIAKRAEYDKSNGKMTKLIDGRFFETSYQYDVLGRLILQMNPDLSTISFVYKDLENRIEAVDETGIRTYNKWNPIGWKIESGVLSNGTFHALEKLGYDDAGRKSWSEDALAHRTQYAYDGFDRLTQTIFADGAKETKQYQDVQRTVTTTDPDGNTIRETFDELDRLIKKELIQSTGGSQVLEESTYDFKGNELTKKDANGNLTQFKYNVMQELVGVIDPEGKQTQYVYDMRGNLTQFIYPDGQTMQKQYDERSRMIKKTDPLGQVEKLYYDANGNLVKQLDRMGQVFSFEYNNRNLLTKKAAGSDVIAFEYDLASRRTKMVDSTGTTGYVYNAFGDLDTVKLQDGKTLSYRYDATRNRIKMKEPFDKETFYQLDNRNRVLSLALDSAASSPEATFSYTKAGNVKEVHQKNGMVSSFAFNEQHRVIDLTQKKADGTVQNTFSYEYDPNGNQTRKTENGLAHAFTYDGLGRIKTSTSFNETYSYDDRGNRLTLQSDQIPSIADATYEYDAWNQVTKVATADGNIVTYAYNGDGLLYERKEGSVATRFYYDGDQLISEASIVNDTIMLKSRYTRNGSQLVSREDAFGNRSYYLHNAHGDINELRDSEGNVLNSYSYDIWGRPLAATETVTNPFRFSGEYWDNTTSLQYLRARWYDPMQGRFMNQDPYEGDVKSPQSLNIYSYVLNNPIRYIDPTGNAAMDDFFTGGGSKSSNGTSGSLRANSGGLSSQYIDVTKPRSRVLNRQTTLTRSEFENNLINAGWAKSVPPDGKVTIFTKNGAKYTVRDFSTSTNGPTIEFFKPDSEYLDLKIRLGKI